MAMASGWQRDQNALARALSSLGNQCERRTSVAGKTPPSVTPSRNRAVMNWPGVRTRPTAMAQTPHRARRMAMKRFALQTWARWPPGIWRRR